MDKHLWHITAIVGTAILGGAHKRRQHRVGPQPAEGIIEPQAIDSALRAGWLRADGLAKQARYH